MIPARLERALELRVLSLWAEKLGVAPALLDVDGEVVVVDPRDFAAERRALIRHARGAIVLAAPREAEVAAADPAGFAADVEARVRGSGLLHYLGEQARPAQDERIRVLGPADRPLLDELLRAAGTDAAEEAEVDVEHPLAVGIVEAGRLVAIASLLEEEAGTVDVGVLVHPEARRRGLGAAVVADVAARAGSRLVQYRSNVENEASARVARACGFVLWGVLSVAPCEDPCSSHS